MKNPNIYLVSLIEDAIKNPSKWEKSYDLKKEYSASHFAPLNFTTLNPYSGINVGIGMMYEMATGRPPFFATFAQIKKMEGIKLKKGSKGIPMYRFVVRKEQDKATGKEKVKYSALKGFSVFSIFDCEGTAKEQILSDLGFEKTKEKTQTPTPLALSVEDSPQKAHKAVLELERLGKIATIHHKKTVPNYELYGDAITLPPVALFEDLTAYLKTLLHEGAHSTMHPDRLDRSVYKEMLNLGISKTESQMIYAKEEIAAESAAVLLMRHYDVLSNAKEQNSKAYLAHWASVLGKGSTNDVLYGISQAVKVFEYLRENKEQGEPQAASN